MTKEELKRIISERFPAHRQMELTDWILSKNFENDLDKFVLEDLQNQLMNDQEIEVDDLNTMAAEILAKSKKGNTPPQKEVQQLKAYQNTPRQHIKLTMFFRIAASLLLVAVFSFITYYFTKNTGNKETIVNIITKENQRGRKSTIFLRDGSIVYLNSESKITYPDVFSDSNRVVHLVGEAYFEISKDEFRPFTVHANNLSINVLGTSFNVNAYEENELVKVSLRSGKVKVKNENTANQNIEHTVILTPGQSISFIKKEDTFSNVSAFNPNLDLSWKDGKIVFQNADMESMLNRFERWYDVDFVVKNKPYFKWNYTGEFHNQSLNDVLELLSFSQSFEFSFNQNKVELVFKPN